MKKIIYLSICTIILSNTALAADQDFICKKVYEDKIAKLE